MARATKHAKRYEPETVHTVELSELFYMLKRHAGQWMRAVSRESDEWNGNMSYAEACAAAEFGQWNAPRIPSLTLPELAGQSDDMRYFNDVAGEQLDVAAYCAGEPECWQVAEPIVKPCGHVIRLAVEIGGLGDVAACDLQTRGEAIVALVNSLELQGHSVEVTVVRAYDNFDNENYRFLIPIKHAGQSIDVRRFQFIIGHPAFYRRCLFGLSEIAQGQDLHTCGTHTKSYAPDGYIHIPHHAGRHSQAMQWAQEFAQRIAEDSQN